VIPRFALQFHVVEGTGPACPAPPPCRFPCNRRIAPAVELAVVDAWVPMMQKLRIDETGTSVIALESPFREARWINPRNRATKPKAILSIQLS